jgi:hypothetical protein
MRAIRATVSVGLGLLLLWALLPGGAALARVLQAPASRVALDLPDSYAPSRLFSGFVDEAAGISLIVLEMPSAAYEQLATGLTPEALARKGVAKVEAGKLARAEPYLYMRGEQISAQGPIAKFLLAVRDKDITALVTANVLKSSIDSGEVTVAQIDRILASASIATAAAPARDAFRLDYLGPFKPAGRVLGTAVAYTLDGRFELPKPGAQRPLLIVAPSIDTRAVPDPDVEASALLKGLPGLADVKEREHRRSEIGGLPAVEIIGTATEQGSGRELALYQALVLPARGGYVRLVGQFAREDSDSLLPEIEKIAQGLRLTE